MRRTALLPLLLGLGFALLGGTASAIAATPQTTLQDVEDEVMCPVCGTLLELAESPQAKRQKVFIARLVDEGKGKAEIKDILEAQYGPAVLALPEAKGFDLTAYLLPAIAFLAAAIALGFGVLRWRRAGDGPSGSAPEAPGGDEAKRLEEDISRYDL